MIETKHFPGIAGPRILIALYDYNARENSDMSFRKGDRMELLDDRQESMFRTHGNLTKILFYFLVTLTGGKHSIWEPIK